jgi:hypothetical protein
MKMDNFEEFIILQIYPVSSITAPNVKFVLTLALFWHS